MKKILFIASMLMSAVSYGGVSVNGTTCLNTSSDRIYHDTNCNNVKDSGEEFIDQAGSVGGGGASSLSVANSGVLVSSPTVGLDFDSRFDIDLQGQATAYIQISSNSLTSDHLAPNSVGASELSGGATSYIQVTSSLQSGSIFYVISGTVSGKLSVGGSGNPLLEFDPSGGDANLELTDTGSPGWNIRLKNTNADIKAAWGRASTGDFFLSVSSSGSNGVGSTTRYLVDTDDGSHTFYDEFGTTVIGKLGPTPLDCSGNANGGALTADASGNIACSDDTSGAGSADNLGNHIATTTVVAGYGLTATTVTVSSTFTMTGSTLIINGLSYYMPSTGGSGTRIFQYVDGVVTLPEAIIDAARMGVANTFTEENIFQDTTTFNGAALFISTMTLPVGVTQQALIAGQIAIDTNAISGVMGAIVVNDAHQQFYVVMTTDTPADNEIPKFDSSTGLMTYEADAGGGGTPGGSNTQFQYNNAGAFGGIAAATYSVTTGEIWFSTKTYFLNSSTAAFANADIRFSGTGKIAWADGSISTSAYGAAFSGYKRVVANVTAGLCQDTNGCSDAVKYETTTNDTMYMASDFASGTTQYWQFSTTLPENYSDGSTFTSFIEWTSTATTTTAVWSVDAKAVGDDDPLDGVWGTAVQVGDVTTAVEDLMRTADTPAITAANSPVGGDAIHFRVYRGDNGTARLARFIFVFATNSLSTED